MSSLKQAEKEFTLNMMDSLSAPVLTFSQAWAYTIPERLLKIITQARLIAAVLKEELATYPEACVYIMTRTFEAPMDDHWTNIYLHVSCTVCEQYWKEDHWDQLKAKRELEDYEKDLLTQLRRRIYDSRRKIVKERIRSVEKEEKSIEKEAIQIVQQQQLSLF